MNHYAVQMTAKPKVYALGHHASSSTGSKVLVTIEPLPEVTDMAGLRIYQHAGNAGDAGSSTGPTLNSFYRSLKLNAGKIVRICDLAEEHDFTSAVLMLNNNSQEVTLDVNKYFNIDGYDPNRCGCYLDVYQYKAAAVEDSCYVARNYSGVLYRHYPTGLIRNKIYYRRGSAVSIFYYRDDSYNSLEAVRQYNGKSLECEFVYDERESLVQQVWYDSKEKIFSSWAAASHPRAPQAPPPAPSAPAPPAPPPPAPPSKQATVAPPNSPETSTDFTESYDSSSDDGHTGTDAGTAPGGLRLKPNDEDGNDEDEGEEGNGTGETSSA